MTLNTVVISASTLFDKSCNMRSCRYMVKSNVCHNPVRSVGSPFLGLEVTDR